MTSNDVMDAGRLRHRLLPLIEQIQTALGPESIDQIRFVFELGQFGQRATLYLRVEAARDRSREVFPRVGRLEEGLERAVRALLAMRDPLIMLVSVQFKIEDFLGRDLYVAVNGT